MRIQKCCALLLVFLLALGLCSCGADTKNSDQKNSSNLSDDYNANSSINIGDLISFGAYPQTAAGNDSTSIQWMVRETNGDAMLLVSLYALDCVTYNGALTDTSWDQCSLRNWLNGSFYDAAFNSGEKQLILSTQISTDTDTTSDKVFLLSASECYQYLPTTDVRMCIPTEYALDRGVLYTNSNREYNEGCNWWLRTSDPNSGAALVACDSHIYQSFGYDILNQGGVMTPFNLGVRPCIWVRISGNITK